MRKLLVALSLFAFTGIASAKVTVSGTGKIVYVPDLGYVSVGVVAEGKTAAEAWERNRLKVEKIFQALKELGLDPRDMQTTGLNVSPKYLHRPKQEPILVGYTVSYDLKLTVRKLDRMAGILDKVVQAGANRSMNISFGCSNYDKYLDEARAKAVAEARKKATIYTSGAGARLGRVLSISEQAFYAQRSFTYEHKLASADRPMPIAVGEQVMSVQIFLEYDLLPEAE
jgi:uncharacterized protein YggE